MPELPDVEVYVECLRERTVGAKLEGLRIANPFLLRSVEPSVQEILGREVREVRRLGKRIIFRLDEDLFVVVHLMIAGRFRWKDEAKAKIPGRVGLCAFDFSGRGTLILTEAGSKRRASLYLVRGEAELETHDRGGLEPLAITKKKFVERLRLENHTLKRTLTDPRLFSGIGNAYSDEILFHAKLSPLKQSQKISDEEAARIYTSTKAVLNLWLDRFREEAKKKGFPTKVTAFRPEMAVHGKYREPCPVCSAPVQRIAYAENEVNYCAGCQSEGRLLKDRSLSRLLKDDWPKNIAEMEELKPSRSRSK